MDDTETQAINRLIAWSYDRWHIVGPSVTNAVAMADGVTTGNYSIAILTAVCTAAVPGIVGAIKYTIESLGPVWTKYRVDRNNAMSGTMLGKIEEMQRESEAARLLAKTYQESMSTYQESMRVERERRQESEQRFQKTLSDMKELSEQTKEQLIRITQAFQAATLRAETAEHAQELSQSNQAIMKSQIEALKVQLDNAKSQQKKGIRKLSKPIMETKTKVEEIATEIHEINDKDDVSDSPRNSNP